jgi:hypothetical protein
MPVANVVKPPLMTLNDLLLFGFPIGSVRWSGAVIGSPRTRGLFDDDRVVREAGEELAAGFVVLES